MKIWREVKILVLDADGELGTNEKLLLDIKI